MGESVCSTTSAAKKQNHVRNILNQKSILEVFCKDEMIIGTADKVGGGMSDIPHRYASTHAYVKKQKTKDLFA